MKKKYQIVFIGPPGSGKGTQAKLLSKYLGVPCVSIGRILRQQIKRNTKVGQQVKNYVNKGKLVPGEVVNQIMENYIKKHQQGFVLDGYPREYRQAKFLDNLTDLTDIFEITLDNKIAKERISGRRNCRCGRIYHIKYKPPKKNNKCDVDGLKLYIRADDKPVAIIKRLNLYRRKARKISALFRKKHILHKVDGRPSIAEIHQSVIKKLK